MCRNMGEVTLRLWSCGCSLHPPGSRALVYAHLHRCAPTARTQHEAKPWGEGSLGKVRAAGGRRMHAGSAVFVLAGRGGGEAVEVWL